VGMKTLPTAVKTQLKALGYDGTAQDLETFEKAKGLAVNDSPDAATLKALANTVAAAKDPNDMFIAGMKDAAVAAAQQNLAKLGYDVGPANGVFDQSLADAIAKFKAQHPELANVGKYMGAPVSNALAAATAAKAPATAPASSKSLVLGEISTRGWQALFPQLQQELASGKIAKGTVISVGSYGIDPKMAKDLDLLRQMGANVKYTPAFSLVRPKDTKNTAWAGRQPGVSGDAAHAGPIPKIATLKTDAEREAWGKELGERMRDEIATAQKSGVKVSSWMLDEVWSSASKDGASAASKRAFEKGVMEGLAQGRDGKTMKGIVYLANLPALVKAKQTPELQAFMKTLDDSSSQIVQEEYPIFGKGVAGAKADADNANAADAALANMGAAGADLAKKVVAGMSPGYREGKLHGLYAEDGKKDGKTQYRKLDVSPADVAAWRKAYLAEREKTPGLAGFGEFGFLGDNAVGSVVDPVIEQTADEIAAG
jgi:hypothetical protein